METTRDKEIRITPSLKKEIIRIVDERIREAHITREDFSELKNIVKELAEAQKGTEQRIRELAQAQKRTEDALTQLNQRIGQLAVRVDDLAEAQKRTEERLNQLTQRVDQLAVRVDELAEAQKRTEQRVEELAQAQKRTEERLNSLAQRVEELAEAQKRTEQRVDELAQAQKRTEERLNSLAQRVEELAEAQRRTEEEIRKLAIGLNHLRGEVGGLARSFGYAFENEAFRMLPKTLKEKYGIEITERFIRTEIGEHEINILGLGRRDGKEVVVVGEAKTRLERMEVFDELDDKAKAVKEAYKDRELVKVLVTHFATKRILKTAEENGVIVIQSFEW